MRFDPETKYIKCAGDVASACCLPSMCKALESFPSIANNFKKLLPYLLIIMNNELFFKYSHMEGKFVVCKNK